jgi:hypothetical protein
MDAAAGGKCRRCGNWSALHLAHALASTDARGKVALMRSAWDFIGPTFARRHALVDAGLALPPLDAGYRLSEATSPLRAPLASRLALQKKP